MEQRFTVQRTKGDKMAEVIFENYSIADILEYQAAQEQDNSELEKAKRQINDLQARNNQLVLENRKLMDELKELMTKTNTTKEFSYDR